MGCRLWGRTESDTTEATWPQQLEQSLQREASGPAVLARKGHGVCFWVFPRSAGSLSLFGGTDGHLWGPGPKWDEAGDTGQAERSTSGF